MNTISMNGRKRPTLTEQIVRLDRILDGLAENLNEAVADAVKEAVGSAVREAIQSITKEVLNTQKLQAQLAPPPAPVPASPREQKPGLMSRMMILVRTAIGQIGRSAATVCYTIGALAQSAASGVAKCVSGCILAVRNRGKKMAHRTMILFRQVRILLTHAGTLAWRFHRSLLQGMAVGTSVGMICYLAGPVISSICSGLAGFAGSLFSGRLFGWWQGYDNQDTFIW